MGPSKRAIQLRRESIRRNKPWKYTSHAPLEPRPVIVAPKEFVDQLPPLRLWPLIFIALLDSIEFRNPPRAKKDHKRVIESPRKRQFPSAQEIETQTQLTSEELQHWEHCVKVTRDLLAAPQNGGLLPQNSPYRRSLLYFYTADMAHKEATVLFKISTSSIQRAKKDRGEALTSILYPPKYNESPSRRGC